MFFNGVTDKSHDTLAQKVKAIDLLLLLVDDFGGLVNLGRQVLADKQLKRLVLARNVGKECVLLQSSNLNALLQSKFEFRWQLLILKELVVELFVVIVFADGLGNLVHQNLRHNVLAAERVDPECFL